MHPEPAPGPAADPAPPAGDRRGTNTTAVLALVFAFLFAPAGIVLGILARGQIARSGESGRRLATAGVVLGSVFTVLGVAVAGLVAVRLIHAAATVSAVEVARAVDDEVRFGGVVGAAPARCPSGVRAEVGRSVRCSVAVDGQPVDVVVVVTSVGRPGIGGPGAALRIGYGIRLEPNPVPRAVLERKVGEILALATGTPAGTTACTGDLPPELGRQVGCTVTSTGAGDGPVEVAVTTTGVDGGMVRFGIAPR